MPKETLMPMRRRLLHWGPVTALSIIIWISLATLYCNSQWWPPFVSVGGFINFMSFLTWVSLCLSNLCTAAFIGPGYVPLRWKPARRQEQENLQFCGVCQGFKAPRAHHCSKCQRCCMKMDHHCPWINNCCGHWNQAYFVQFLLYAIIGCLHASYILGSSLYYALFRIRYILHGAGREFRIHLNVYALFIVFMSFTTAVSVAVAVGVLFIVNLRAVFRNRTGIEEYIVSKAEKRPRNDVFVFPYDLGWKTNFEQTFRYGSTPPSDGIRWPVKEGCQEYSLTKEQCEQKRLKRSMACWCEVVQSYNGSLCIPRRLGGLFTFCSQCPFTGEDRLSVKQGDRLLITRWRRRWCYGQVITVRSNTPLSKGWLPILCVQQLDEEESAESSTAEKDENDTISLAVDNNLESCKDSAFGNHELISSDMPDRLKRD